MAATIKPGRTYQIGPCVPLGWGFPKRFTLTETFKRLGIGRIESHDPATRGEKLTMDLELIRRHYQLERK